MTACLWCGAEAGGGRVCPRCQRPLPRFLVEDESRDLGVVQDDVQVGEVFYAEGVHRAIRYVLEEFSATRDEEGNWQRIAEMEEVVVRVVEGDTSFLQQFDYWVTQVAGGPQSFSVSREEALGGLETFQYHFEQVFACMRGYLGGEDPAMMEEALAQASAGMAELGPLDRLKSDFRALLNAATATPEGLW